MTRHVYPKNDERDHEFNDDGSCWCNPTREKALIPGAAAVFTHNSADGREFVEENMNELLDDDKTWEIHTDDGNTPVPV